LSVCFSFSPLLELLAANTKAKNIHILAYSAGAQVVTPGLEYLVDEYPDLSKQELKENLRIGEVYFAAPDTDFETFVERYLKFISLLFSSAYKIVCPSFKNCKSNG